MIKLTFRGEIIDMYKWEVFMETMITLISIEVTADTKAKATYKAYKEWRGKELSSNIPFNAFLKYFYQRTLLIE